MKEQHSHSRGPSQQGGGVPEQYDRLIEERRLIHSRLSVQFPICVKRFSPLYIGIPPYSDCLIGGTHTVRHWHAHTHPLTVALALG